MRRMVCRWPEPAMTVARESATAHTHVSMAALSSWPHATGAPAAGMQ